jgi:hypothetical protein
MEPRWTTRETSNVLKVSEQTLANWRWRGCGPPYEKLNGVVRYDPQAVREWAAAQTQTSTSDRSQARAVR